MRCRPFQRIDRGRKSSRQFAQCGVLGGSLLGLAHQDDDCSQSRSAITNHLATDQVVSLDSGRSLIDRGDACVAQQLRRPGLFDITHAAMDLHAQPGDFVAGLGKPALDDRDHEINECLLARPLSLVGMSQRFVDCRGDGVGQRPHRFRLRPHQHQHAPYIRMANDGHGCRRAFYGPALDSLFGIGQGHLVGTLRQAQTFQADRVARRVHHDEHVLQAFVCPADQIADATTMVAVSHHGCRAGVDAQLVLDRYAIGIVASAETAIGIDEELGHHKQRNAFDAFRGVRQTGKHQMDDVLRHVVIAVSNKYLLPENAVAAVSLRFGARPHRRQIGTRLRLGQIHGAGPLAADHLWQIGFLLLLRTNQFDRLDGAAGQ